MNTPRIVLSSALRTWTHSLSPSNNLRLRQIMAPPLPSTKNIMNEVVELQNEGAISIPDLLPKYLEMRSWDWNLPTSLSDSKQDDSDTKDNTIAVFSHLLTFPLTISYCTALLNKKRNPNEVKAESSETESNICIIGARAEASLPLPYWEENFHSNDSTTSDQNLNTNITFIGPDVPKQSDKVHKVTSPNTNTSSNVTIKLNYETCMLDDVNNSELLKYTSFVLFNPGLGHPKLKSGWAASLEKIKAVRLLQSKPADVIITCFAEYDVDRDLPLIKAVFGDGDGDGVNVHVNPFMSRRGDVDDERVGGVVNSNGFVILVE